MHILMIPSWYATQRNPIRGSFFRDQALALQEAGHQVGLLVPPSRLRTLHGLRETMSSWRKSPTDITVSDDNGLKIYRMPWWGWIASVRPWQRGALGLEIFDRYVSDMGKPDVLHGQSILYGGYLAAYIGRTRHIASVVTEHNTMFARHLIQPNQAAFIRYTMQQVDQMLAVSASLARAVQPFGDGRPVEVVGNVVNTDLFRPPDSAIPDNPFVITTIGRLETRKSQDNVLRAFASVFGGKDAQLHIVGDGPKRAEYQQLSQKLMIEGQVTFWGLQPATEVKQIIQNSHVVVSASKVETFGVTLIEALACGKPVIATRSGGPEDFIGERDGILIDVDDVRALEDALVQMQRDYHLYDSQAIRQSCIDRYSKAAIAKQLERVYESIKQN